MKLDIFFKKNYFIIITSLLVLVFLVFLIWQNQIKLQRIADVNHNLHIIANEFRQSSDNLTRYCRTYVMTGDPIWEKKYRQVLAIRKGTEPRSEGQYISLLALVNKMGLTKEETANLKEAAKKSNKLKLMEKKAFKAMQGVFVDNTGKYSLKKYPDKRVASNIMFAAKYHSDKIALIKTIDEFSSMVYKRTKSMLSKYQRLGNWYLGIIIVVILFLIARSLHSYFLIKNQIILQMDELANNAEIFKAIFNGAKDGIMLADAVTLKFVRVNDTACQMLGYEKDEFLELSVSSIHPVETLPDVLVAFEKQLRGEVRITADFIARRKNGTTFFIDINSSVVTLNDRRFLVCFFRDVSERKRYETQLEETEKIISMSQSVAFLWKNADGWPVEHVTSNILGLTGYSAKEFLEGAVTYSVIIHPDDLLNVNYEISLYSKDVACLNFSHKPYRIVSKSGDVKWVDDYTTIRRDLSGNITNYQGVVLDITARMEVKQELKNAKQKAEDASRAKSEFLAKMSHEIRTPMNSVLGFADILKELEIDSQKSSYINNICTSGRSMLKLINNILDLSKVEAGKMELQNTLTSLRSLHEEMRTLFSQKMEEKGLLLELVVEDNVPETVIFDESRLWQIFTNLLGNAAKFTHDGFVSLRTSCQLSKGANGKKVDLVFTISDSGIGVPGNQQQSMFVSFEQVKEHQGKSYGGTGLGLAITKQIIALMGGEISVESKVDIGTIFTIAIPNVEIATGVTVLQETIDPEQVVFAPGKVLIVDDLDDNREMLAIYLSESDLTIYQAENGAEAIKKAKEFQPDIILLDLKMPVMDGYELAATLKSDIDTNHIPLVAITASAFKNAEIKVKKNCEGYLRKPVSKKDLVKELTKFISYDIQDGSHPNNYKNGIAEIFTVSAMLKKVLEVDFLESCFKIQKSNDLGDIAQFAKSLVALSEEYGEAGLSYFANTLLLNATQIFDIDRIVLLLEQFVQTINPVEQV